MSKKTFQINKEIYLTHFIDEAISAFSGYSIVLSNDIITIQDEDPQFVFDELMNYTLSLILE